MHITPSQLAALVHEVEQDDPIDFADLPFDQADLRELVANHLCEMVAGMDQFSNEDRQLTLLAVAAKLVLENLVLHLQLLRCQGAPIGEDAASLLDRLRQRR